MDERVSHAITRWLPLSAVASGLTMVAGSLLNLPANKTIMAAITAGALTLSAFLFRAKKEQGQHADAQVTQQP